MLDPTDDTGALLSAINVVTGVQLWSVPTTLALVNEPPVGFDVNVATEQTGRSLLLSAARDIAAGEELFMDYGPLYDRSRYGRPVD